MGLLDQVLGQVLGGGGGLAPGGRSDVPQTGGGFGGGSGGGLGGLANALPGGLGGLLSGNKGPLALAILALLASKHLKNGAGGYGSILHDMFAGGGTAGGQGSGGAPTGQDVSRPQGGGFLDQIGGMLGGGQPTPGGGGFGGNAGGGGGLGGALGGGLGGGLLGGGLGDLLNRFQQNGQGDVAQSWINHGPNQPISPDELENALGPQDIDNLSRETGMDRGELLSGLSQTLPQVIDGLTPNGRLPTEDEHGTWV